MNKYHDEDVVSGQQHDMTMSTFEATEAFYEALYARTHALIYSDSSFFCCPLLDSLRQHFRLHTYTIVGKIWSLQMSRKSGLSIHRTIDIESTGKTKAKARTKIMKIIVTITMTNTMATETTRWVVKGSFESNGTSLRLWSPALGWSRPKFLNFMMWCDDMKCDGGITWHGTPWHRF